MRILASIFLVVVLILIVVFGFINGNKATEAKQGLDGERYGRMIAEEGLEAAKTKIISLTRDNKRQENKIKSIERLLKQTTASNKDFKAKITKMKETKQMLESRIKELEQIIVQTVPANTTSGM